MIKSVEAIALRSIEDSMKLPVLYHITSEEVVAIKVIDLKSLRDDVIKSLLRIELECIKKINHPNLLKYIDSFETVNNCYIITELCDGGDLEKNLKKKGKYTEK